MFARVRNLLRVLRHRHRWETELQDELRSHLDARAADLVSRGLTPPEAIRRARIELGPTERYRDEARAASGLQWPDDIWQDLRYVARTLRRAPSFAVVAVVSLALGVGANAVVFSVVDAVILRPLPIARPEEVVYVQPNFYTSFSYPNFRDVAARATRLSGMAGYSLTQVAISTDQQAERVWSFLVTANYFDLLGVRPAVGRLFASDDDRAAGATPQVVLSHPAWQRRFAGDSAIVGRSIPVNGRPYQVVGVADQRFHGTEVVLSPELFIPLAMQADVMGRSWLESRDTWNLFTIGRLAPGASRDAAAAELSTIAAALAREYPDANRGLTISLARPGLFGDQGRQPVAAFAIGIQVLALLVLLAACANLASLFTARISDRAPELAVRMSIGAA